MRTRFSAVLAVIVLTGVLGLTERPAVANTDPEAWSDGSFVQVTDGQWAGSFFRVVGGYPMPVTGCGALGGCAGAAPVTSADYATWAAAHPVIADHAYLRIADGGMSGQRARAAGGHLFHLTGCEWRVYAGCSATVEVNEAAYTAYDLAHPTAADGTYLAIGDGQMMGVVRGRVVGGGVVLVGGLCPPGEGDPCLNPVYISQPSFIAYFEAHPHIADGTFVRIADARPESSQAWYARAVGGTLLALTSCAPAELAGCPGALTLPSDTFRGYTSRYPRPEPGTVVKSVPSGRYYRYDADGCVATDPVASAIAVTDGSVTCRPALANITVPTVSGRPRPGHALRASAGSWTSDAALAVAYQWFRGAKPIPRATGSSYVVRRRDRGHHLQVRVAVSTAGAPATSATSAPTRKVRK